MERDPLKLKIDAADREVWEGEAVNIISRTTEGDIGILPGHEPLMAILVPGVVDIVTADGRSEQLAIDGGFLSVADGHVWILAQDAVMAEEVSIDDAHRQISELSVKINSGEADDQETHRYHILQAQIRAAEKAQQR